MPMGDGAERTPPPVTIRGGPAGPPPDAEPRQRPRLLPLLVGLAALAVVVSAVVGQRSSPAPALPDCGERCDEPLPLVVGAALPLTGALAPFGAAQRRGAELALQEVNAAGGVEVGGERRQVELLVRDTRSLPDVAGQEALILVRGPFRVVALLGPCTPPVALVRVAESRQVPLVTGCQPLPPVGPAQLRHTWQVAPAERERAVRVLDALDAAPGSRVALFLSNDRSAEPWTAAASGAGLDVGTYRPQGADWRPAVAQAAADGADVVVAVTQPPEGVALWSELAARGVDPEPAYASEGGLGTAWYRAVEDAGADGDGVLTDLVHGPVARDDARPVGPDESVTAVSAELTRVLLDGLARADEPERLAVSDAMAGASGTVAGRPVRFLGDHVSRLPVALARWEDGRLVPLPTTRTAVD